MRLACLLVLSIAASVSACTSESEQARRSSGGAGGGPTTSTGGGGAGAAGGAGGAGVAGEGGQGGEGGAAGAGGAGGGWPTCDAQPATATARTIPQIWQANPAAPDETWVSGAIVTAVSRGGCSAAEACQIFLQADGTYADFDTGAHHGIKIFVSAATSHYFTAVQVGDVVDALGHAWRYDLEGQNELLLQVNSLLPGCAKVTGVAIPPPAPIPGVTLDELTVTAYEVTHGPLLVQVAGVTGNPNMPAETFGIWPTGSFPSGGPTVSLSPFFLTGAAFTGLVDGVTTDFTSVSGVFGLFVPPPVGPKFVEIYPRDMAELVMP
jgi:hypothetical protein